VLTLHKSLIIKDLQLRRGADFVSR